MAVYIPAGFAQCTLVITREGDPEPYNVTWGSAIGGDPYTIPLSGWIDMFEILAPALGGNERMLSVKVRQGPSTDPDAPTAEFPLGIDGTDLAARLPPNVAILLRKVTALGGRKNRGRLYWPSCAESTVSDTGELVTSTQNAFNDIFEDWRNNWRGYLELGEHVILHNSETAPTQIEGYVCQPLAATQRRRLRR